MEAASCQILQRHAMFCSPWYEKGSRVLVLGRSYPKWHKFTTWNIEVYTYLLTYSMQQSPSWEANQ